MKLNPRPPIYTGIRTPPVEVVRGSLFKSIEEEKGLGWLGSGAQAGHSDSWNN